MNNVQPMPASETRKFFAALGTRTNPDRWDGDRDTTINVSAQQNIANSSRWAASGGKYWGVSESCEALPPGVYNCKVAEGIGFFFDRIDVKTDNLMVLPDPVFGTILSEFERFWRLKDAFLTRGYLHKRGFLFWGPPGSGKTSLLQLMARHLVESLAGVVVFIDNPNIATHCLHLLRKIEPGRPVVCILEDVDALCQNYSEGGYLALLDGENQIDNVIYVATTNYPERLDPRFVDRPSRFDTIKYIGMPTAEARRVYLSAKEPSLVESGEIDYWVERSEGFSVAHLREMIIANRCFEQPIDEVVARLEDMRVNRPSSDQNPDMPKEKFGF
jgi:energy-coupling factor transporter ATP-binding protein EcfA2